MKKIALIVLSLNIYAYVFSQSAYMDNSLNATLPCSITTNIVSQTDVSCFGGNNGSATITGSNGTAPYTYSWSPTGGTASTATNLAAGTYTCLIKDVNLCPATRTVSIIQPTQLVSAIGSFTNNVTCVGLQNGGATILVNGGSPNYSYIWTPSAQTTSVMSNVGAGTYTCFVSDGNGCSTSSSVTISQPTAPIIASSSFTHVSCFGSSNGSAQVTISPPSTNYYYNWVPYGGNYSFANNLTAGSYTCIITNTTTNCSTSKSFNIFQPSALTTSYTSNPSCGNSNGSATVIAAGGTPGYNIVWNNLPGVPTGSTATNLPPGNWIASVTDAQGCVAVQTVVVTSATAPIITSFSVTPPSCFGLANGYIVMKYTSGIAPYTLTWPSPISQTLTSSALTQTVFSVPSGAYTATLTDANGCSTSQMINLTSPNPITTVPSQTNVSCNGSTNGSASVLASGGTGSYTYSWSPTGGTASTATNLAAGTYTCLIKDANNCTKIQLFTITQSTASTIDNTTNLIAGTLSSNQYNATYQWINCGTGNSNVSGATTQTFTPVINGSYAVIINYNGCTVTSSCTTISNVGIEEYQLANHVSIYPNPSSSQFNFDGLEGENTIQITDITGRALLTEKTFTESHTLKLDAAQGIYFYKITDKQNRVHQGKLILQ